MTELRQLSEFNKQRLLRIGGLIMRMDEDAK